MGVPVSWFGGDVHRRGNEIGRGVRYIARIGEEVIDAINNTRCVFSRVGCSNQQCFSCGFQLLDSYTVKLGERVDHE